MRFIDKVKQHNNGVLRVISKRQSPSCYKYKDELNRQTANGLKAECLHDSVGPNYKHGVMVFFTSSSRVLVPPSDPDVTLSCTLDGHSARPVDQEGGSVDDVCVCL